ncbi:MAG TPA: hypothetical protein VFQ43_18895, partial [Nitrososphaera sp.]|nr:hypothetical protein [Nitrososphaera sp.]
MLLVVFGAGASYDSAPSYPPGLADGTRPPLANQLFENRPRFADALASFYQCQPLVPRLRQPSEGVTVEHLLEEYQTQARDYPQRYKQLAAIRYYLHFVLWEVGNYRRSTHRGVTNYNTLLDDLERWRQRASEKICLVTFNYDKILESALPVLGIDIRDLAGYITNDNYKIIKIHGSVDWGHEVETTIDLENKNQWEIAHELIDKAAMLKFSDRYHIVDSHPIASGPYGADNRRIPLFPAIALPVVKKSAFECPDEHLNVLRELLPRVTEILTIGWRGNEEHFLALLRNELGQPPRMMIVANNEDGANQIGSELMRMGI